ncbi:hypothetical protein QBC44DRAFT_316031 [Cladorrhinum sp. PSN332]|nr:hypothetical protein QBC44DRAFT_316031 [Cladorrhinum sp. PSN332]
MFESMLPKLQLDAVWTQEHESRLQQEWEGHPLREALLCARSHRFAGNLLQQPAVALEECALWENTSFYFGCLPSDIISAQHRMMVIPDKVHNYPRIMPKVEGHGSNVQSILWGLKFCRNLNDILLHPIWEGRPILLREAIKYTVVCASGDDERYQTPAMMAAKVYGTNPFQHSDPVQLLYKAIELVAKNEVHKVRKEKKQKVCGRASKTGKDIVYLVRASDITLLTAALQWTDFWSGESGTILSSAWKGIARQLEKPWRVLTEKHQDRGLEQLYLDVLRHQRRWALEV